MMFGNFARLHGELGQTPCPGLDLEAGWCNPPNRAKHEVLLTAATVQSQPYNSIIVYDEVRDH